MPTTWLEVVLHDSEFSDDFRSFYVGGAAYQIGAGTGRKVYRCTAADPVDETEGFTADDGTTAVDQPGDAFSADRPRALLSNRASKHINGSPRHLEVTISFKDPTGGEPAEDLLALPAKIVSDPINITEEYSMDCDDTPKPVRNSAGEPFDNAPQRDAAGRIYTIEKYVDDSAKAIIRAQERTNNTGSVTIDGFVHADNTLYLKPAHFEPVQTFNKVTLTIIYNPNGWADKALDVGFSEIVGGDRKDITQKDAGGNDVPVPKPWPLNSDGTKKASPTDDIDELTFYPYPYGDWTGVPLS